MPVSYLYGDKTYKAPKIRHVPFLLVSWDLHTVHGDNSTGIYRVYRLRNKNIMLTELLLQYDLQDNYYKFALQTLLLWSN